MRSKGTLWIAAGFLLLAAAFGLTGYNLRTEHRAEQTVETAMIQLAERREMTAAAPSPDRSMPTWDLGDHRCIGVLEIPALGLQLPVMEQWSDAELRFAPCRYAGSAYLNDLVICAHNYAAHFGSIGKLSFGDEVTFTDMDGNIFRYQAADIEILPPDAVEEMTAAEWDLTLFTCTLGGASRVTVRCTAC